MFRDDLYAEEKFKEVNEAILYSDYKSSQL